jgi:hypothetical protein
MVAPAKEAAMVKKNTPHWMITLTVLFTVGCGSKRTVSDTQVSSSADLAADLGAGGKKPCPPRGLGVVSSSGKLCKGITDPSDPDLLDCQAQLENAKDYNCTKPQLCVDRTTERALNFIISPFAPSFGLSFVISNCSTGTQDLVISKVDVLGDDRCHFTFDFAKDVLKSKVAPGDQTLIQNRYLPKKPGEDHAVLVVHSNANNFPVLRLLTCGLGVAQHAPGQDAGSPVFVDLGAVNEAGFIGMACKDSTTKAPCH